MLHTLPTPDTACVDEGMRMVRSSRIDLSDGSIREHQCLVIEERDLHLQVAGGPSFRLAWTRTGQAPQDRTSSAPSATMGSAVDFELIALCVGYLHSQFLIDDLNDLAEISPGPAATRVIVTLQRIPALPTAPASAHAPRANKPAGNQLRLKCSDLLAHLSEMERGQQVFRAAGGAHAAAVFSPQRGIVASAEDMGRHNALDKVIGQCLLQGTRLVGAGVLLSSRVNRDLVAKCARAGIELVAGISAPSSLAIEAAQAAGITLCGHIRDGRITAFTHPHRLLPEHQLA